MINRPKTKNSLRWLYPGMKVKRWLLLAILGVVLISLGMSLTISVPYFRSIYLLWNRFAYGLFDHYWATVLLGIIGIAAGAALIMFGLQKMNRSIISAIHPPGPDEVATTIFKKRPLERGPHIVAVGGGHGLHTLLHGLKNYTSNVTAIVTVFDDGGSSGRIRKEGGGLPPGDIRNCLIALAETEPLMRDLFQHRFENEGELKGHNFGNLFITALTQVTGDFQKAILESSKVLAVRGRVLPTTLQNAVLKAECEDGTLVEGESKIGSCGKKIKRLFLDPPQVQTTEEVLAAIQTADLIVLGPGSLFTSVLCNLAVKEVREAIIKAQAPLVFVCNITTQPGETDRFSLAEHLQALWQFIPPERLQYLLVNDQKPENQVLAELRSKGIDPITMNGIDIPPSLKVLKAPLLSLEQPTRHDPRRLAQAIVRILLEEKPSWGFYFTFYTDQGFKNLKIVRWMNHFRVRSLIRLGTHSGNESDR
ncbi:MAG: hypothetical protein PWP04_1388 [Candidatus Atribacteria bacterium]|nr:hypothetical protein [Candidatus Atribacteria bacterium]